jgi:choline dehydrogenase-like flavoprotein
VLSDARELANGQQVEVDVCIVGAGPARMRIARELIGNRGQTWLLDSAGREVERRMQRPFDRNDMDTYSKQTWAECQLGPIDYDLGCCADRQRTPPLPLLPGAVKTTIFQHGTADFDDYYQELVRGPTATLVLHDSVVELITGDDPGWVDRLESRREDGSRSSVRTRPVVLASGGIEDPRLRLLSRRVHRNRLGNGHGLVGRSFAERMTGRTGYIVAGIPRADHRAGLYPVLETTPGVRAQGALRVRETSMSLPARCSRPMAAPTRHLRW